MASPKRVPPQCSIDIEFSRTHGGLPWKRSPSAGDLVKLIRGPNRRIFDASTHPEELVSPSSAIEKLSEKPLDLADPARRVTIPRFRARTEGDFENFGDTSPVSSPARSMCPPSPTRSIGGSSVYGARQERALENWRTGESCRIMTHIAPVTHRPISLYGDVFQGKWRTDWSEVAGKQMWKMQYPAERTRPPGETLPAFPQGMTSEEIRRNRGFVKSHGSARMDMGLMAVGALGMLP